MSNHAYNFHPAENQSLETKPVLFSCYAENQALAIEVLSGLNQGEQLKLDESPIIIGGNDECDLYLVEPNIKQPCLVIEKIGTQVCIRTFKDSCNDTYYGSQDNLEKIEDQHILNVDEKFCVGGVWFRLFDASKSSGKATEKSVNKKSQNNAHDSINKHSKITLNSLNKLNNTSKTTQHYAYSAKPIVLAKQENQKVYWDIFKAGSVVMSSLCICALTISAAQGFSQTNTSERSSLEAGSNTSAEVKRISEQEIPNGDILTIITKDNVVHNQEVKEISAEQLRYLQTVFSNMLIERELPQNLKLGYEDRQFSVTGLLTPQKEAVLDRMINRFKQEQGLTSPFVISVKPSVSALPFEIIQVTSGKYGNIVTDSGKRLFVGDSQSGYQLVAIQDHQLVFSGKSKITVSW